MENYVKEYLVIMYDAKMEAGYEHGYYDTEEEALNVAKELSETNHLTETEAEHSFVSVERWNEKELTHNDTIARFPCSWMRAYFVRLFQFRENNGYTHSVDLEPIITNKMNSTKNEFEDYVDTFMDNETVTGEVDFDFRFYEPDPTDNLTDRLIASIYVQCEKDGTYKVHPVEEY